MSRGNGHLIDKQDDRGNSSAKSMTEYHQAKTNHKHLTNVFLENQVHFRSVEV